MPEFRVSRTTGQDRMMAERFWLREPDAPYATLLRVIETYCHPEIGDDDAYETLKRRVRRTDLNEMHIFKDELRHAVRDPGALPKGSLSLAAEYEDGNERAFLNRLWRDLYDDEPV